MKFFSNEQVANTLNPAECMAVMREAFLQYQQGGAMQERVRIDAGQAKLSMMGAIAPGIGAAGAKVYTTINGRFNFVVLLFSAEDGKPLAVMEGDTMTEFRTAAVTALAADALARPDAATLAICGTGVQARAHVPALLPLRAFKQVLVAGIDNPQGLADEIGRRHGIACKVVSFDQAAAEADVLLTATRSPVPLFDGKLVKPDAFVAAIGSSKPDTREIDETLVRRAADIVVEWKPQAQKEAGDLLLCAPGAFDWAKVRELGEVLSQPRSPAQQDGGIILYKAIGVGLEDLALAEHIWRKDSAAAA